MGNDRDEDDMTVKCRAVFFGLWHLAVRIDVSKGKANMKQPVLILIAVTVIIARTVSVIKYFCRL